MGRCFLVLSASMGAGHDTVAGELVRRLEARGHRAVRADVLDLLPGPLGDVLRGGYGLVVRHAPWVYAAVYRAFFTGLPGEAAARYGRPGVPDGPPPPSPGGGPRRAGRLRPSTAPVVAPVVTGVEALVARHRPDAVVSTFHLAAQATGRLRGEGALAVPCAVAVTDFAVHRQWTHPGNDLHLCPGPAAARRAALATGRAAVPTGPVVPPAFLDVGAGRGAPGPVREGRSAPFGRDVTGERVVLLSVGSWGAGYRIWETARLLSGAGYLPVVMCGHDDALRRRLASVGGLLALGWVADVPGLMSAASVLVENAAGQTAAQALAAGLPVIGYRPVPGHGAAGVREMAAAGVTTAADDPWELLQAVDALSGVTARRERQVAAGRALFTGGRETARELEALAEAGAVPGRDPRTAA